MSSASSPPKTSRPVVLGTFELLSELGAGTFAMAYLARQIGSQRMAVVKIAHRHLLQGPQAKVVRQRFADEFNAATRVRHPNLATVFTHGAVRERPAIAMEYIEGESLDDLLLERAPLPFDLIDHMMRQLLAVLARVHAAGIIHRDVSPHNIVFGEDEHGQPHFTLLDFGIASIDQQSLKTQGPIGTPRYMAPEQIDGNACLRSDIYSLGAILWWALTGEELHNDLKGLRDLIRRLDAQNPSPDLRSLLPVAPASLRRLLELMLRPDAQARPSASMIADAWPRVANDCAQLDRQRPGTLTGLPSADRSRESLKERTTLEPPSRPPSSLPPGAHSASFDTAILEALLSLAPEQFEELSSSFLVEIPEHLMDLEEALTLREPTQTDSSLRAIRNHAMLVGGRHLVRLCQMVEQLDHPDFLDQRLGLLEEMSGEYQRICKHMISQRRAHAPSSQS